MIRQLPLAGFRNRARHGDSEAQPQRKLRSIVLCILCLFVAETFVPLCGRISRCPTCRRRKSLNCLPIGVKALGRGDRKGAFRLAAFMSAVFFLCAPDDLFPNHVRPLRLVRCRFCAGVNRLSRARGFWFLHLTGWPAAFPPLTLRG